MKYCKSIQNKHEELLNFSCRCCTTVFCLRWSSNLSRNWIQSIKTKKYWFKILHSFSITASYWYAIFQFPSISIKMIQNYKSSSLKYLDKNRRLFQSDYKILFMVDLLLYILPFGSKNITRSLAFCYYILPLHIFFNWWWKN